MGLCKCPKRKVTNQFCFDHLVNVCEHCMVHYHPKCTVQSYLKWLADNDYDSSCTLCGQDLEQYDCVRLVCYHIFHWKCLNQQQSQLPPNTASHGRTCPVCRKEIFPTSNLVSPVADVLKERLATTNWGRQGLGLALFSKDLSQIKESANIGDDGSFTQSTYADGQHHATHTTATASSLSNNMGTTSNVNTTTKVHHSGATMERSKSAVSSINPHSVVQMDAFNHHALGAINSNYTNPAVSMAEGNNSEAFANSRRPLLPRQNPIGGSDRDDDKYARRTASEMLSRWSRRFYAPSSRPPWRRTWFLVVSGILAFTVIIYVMARLGRAGGDTALVDSERRWNNPNPEPRRNMHYD